MLPMATKVFSLRLPEELIEQIRVTSDAECRSMNETIEYAIRRYLAAYAEVGPVIVRP
jgi:metal-responsive CopG/Arc/MetJ family transcriptional regulator